MTVPLQNNSLVQVTGLSKKFCKDLKYNMYYGIQELVQHSLGIKENYNILRKNEFWVFKDLTFTINSGEIIGLLGINGSGKTTLIRMLAGIYNVQKGNIYYNNPSLKAISIFALRSGFHPSLTGRDNLFLNGAYFGLSKKQIVDRLDFIESFSAIGDHLDTPFGKYSSGMKTRLAMSLALSIEADILYVDEAFSFSDPSFKTKCFEWLKKKYSVPNKALIIATHRLGKIENLVNRILLIDDGKIIKDTKDIDSGVKKYISICDRLNKDINEV